MSDHSRKNANNAPSRVKRRDLLLSGGSLLAASTLAAAATRIAQAQQPAPAPAPAGQRPNILVIFGDDIGQTNISAYSFGVMGYRTPNIDRTPCARTSILRSSTALKQGLGN